MIKRIAALLTVALLGVAGLATPAQAAAADCPSGYLCIWSDGNYTGARWQISTNTLIDSQSNGTAVPGWIDDIGSSIYNRQNVDIYVFDGSNCGSVGWRRLITSGQKLTAPGSAINDRISSVQRWNAFPLLCNL